MLCLAFSIAIHAQLKINSTGNIGIGISPAASSKMLITGDNRMVINANLINSTETNKCAVHGTVFASSGINYGMTGESLVSTTFSIPSGQVMYPNLSAGLFGVGYGPRRNGIIGNILSDNWQSAAVYGMVAGLQTTINSNLAAAFTGNIRSTGTIWAYAVTTTSDATLKQNIRNIDGNVMEKLKKLQPVQYQWNKAAYIKATYEKSEEFTEEQLKYASELLDDDIHYGLLAQDLQKIFPGLVNDKEDVLSINYIELIPMLIQAVQDLNAELQELKQSASVKKITSNRLTTDADDVVAVLYQNSPNPFSEQTQISYILPMSVRDAHMYIYNMSGEQLGEYTLIERGESSLTISANEYAAGMYLYALIADGMVIDTKRMILTK